MSCSRSMTRIGKIGSEPFRNNWRASSKQREEQFLGRKIRPMASRKPLFPERDLFSWKRGFHILANRGISFVTDTETRNIPTTRVTSVLATPRLFSFFLFHLVLSPYFGSYEEKKKISMQRVIKSCATHRSPYPDIFPCVTRLRSMIHRIPRRGTVPKEETFERKFVRLGFMEAKSATVAGGEGKDN